MPANSYKVIRCESGRAEAEINEAASQGWKVVAVTSHMSNYVFIILEKH